MEGDSLPPLFNIKSIMQQEKNTTAEFDPLDMNNYKIEKLPKMKKSTFKKWMARIGGPLAILAFVLVIGS